MIVEYIMDEFLDNFEVQSRLLSLKEIRNFYCPYTKIGYIFSHQSIKKTLNIKNINNIVSIAGRVMGKRVLGKLIFLNIIGNNFINIQVIIKKDLVNLDIFNIILKNIYIGDIIGCYGILNFSDTGELSVFIQEQEDAFLILSKAFFPFPEKYSGLKNVDIIYKNRWLDTLTNKVSYNRFRDRSKIIFELRRYLDSLEYIEVETPILSTVVSGAMARPFKTYHNTLEQNMYLRIAPELYLKRCVICGYEKVFEIAKVFRNEGIDSRHNPEFTILETYTAYMDFNMGILYTQDLIMHLIEYLGLNILEIEYKDKILNFSLPWKVISMQELILEYAKIDLSLYKEKEDFKNLCIKLNLDVNENMDILDYITLIFEELISDKIDNPTFVIGHSSKSSPLAKKDPLNANTALRFELYIAGMEIANAYCELNDPFEQLFQFKNQVLLSKKKKKEDDFMVPDYSYVNALYYGLPPTFGLGIGIDRLIMILTNAFSIRDIILFPTLKD